MKKICLEQKGQPPTRATLDEPNLNYKKVGSARRMTHLI